MRINNSAGLLVRVDPELPERAPGGEAAGAELFPADPRAVHECSDEVGLNHRDHAAESGFDLPDEPVVFTKYVSSFLGHHIGSNFFWYLNGPAGNFPGYYSDMDATVDDQTWTPEDFEGASGLYRWGPPPPRFFLHLEDLAALMAGSHSTG